MGNTAIPSSLGTTVTGALSNISNRDTWKLYTTLSGSVSLDLSTIQYTELKLLTTNTDSYAGPYTYTLYLTKNEIDLLNDRTYYDFYIAGEVWRNTSGYYGSCCRYRYTASSHSINNASNAYFNANTSTSVDITTKSKTRVFYR